VAGHAVTQEPVHRLNLRGFKNLLNEPLEARALGGRIVGAENFNQTAIPGTTVRAFLREFSERPKGLLASIETSRNAKRDFGPNDLTVFRKKPLITEAYGHLPSHVIFLIEKFETGPYWRLNDVGAAIGDRLRRFWGAVFETYMNDLIRTISGPAGVRFISDPRLATDKNIQICDGLIVEGEALVVMEYKASMFTARAKYSGDHVRLRDEIASKLVRDVAERRKKGVEQLAEAITLLFSDPTREVVEGLDVSQIKRVYPVLITLDDVGASLLISKLLNFSFDALFKRDTTNGIKVNPILCTDIESLEVLLPYVAVKPLSEFLQYWLDNDPKLLSTLLARFPEGLPQKRNDFLDREWKALYEEIGLRLFREQASKTGK
jgi:hypothetical protein